MKRKAPAAGGGLVQADRVFQYALLGMLASGYGAVLGSGALDAPTALLAGVALAARAAWLAGWWRFEIPQRWADAVGLAALALFAVEYFLLRRPLIDATVHLVFVVAAVKLLTARTGRDFALLKVVAFLELLAASVLSNNLNFFVCLILFLYFTVATLMAGELRRSSAGLAASASPRLGRRLLVLSGLSSVAILTITAGLFFVLPRTARAALERLVAPEGRVAGFAQEVTLGQPGAIRRESTPVMHVQFPGAPPPRGLKWRGTALAEFDGWKWYNSGREGDDLRVSEGMLRLAEDEQLRRPGTRLTYQVVLHAPAGDSLFVAGRPEYIRLPATRVRLLPTGGLRIPYVEAEGFRYVVYSYLDRPGEPVPGLRRLAGTERNFYLRLPPVDPRVMQLAHSVTAGARTDRERALALERHLQTEYTYSLEPLGRMVDDPLAHFLLERRKGHCEYFASSLAVMLRLLWIPARVATGFQEGVYNPISGWQVVRASDAHSWVEVWLPEAGWVALDPTPPSLEAAAPTLRSRLGMLLDAADVFWQEWVLGYDIDRQLTLAFELNRRQRSLEWSWPERWWTSFKQTVVQRPEWNRNTAMLALLALLALAGGVLLAPRLDRAWTGWRRRRRALLGTAQAGDATLLYQEFLIVLKARGVEKPAWMTPLEFAAAAHDRVLAGAVVEFTAAYNEFRFGTRPGGAAGLEAMLESIRHLPKQTAGRTF